MRAGQWKWDHHHGWTRFDATGRSAALVYALRGDWLGTDYGGVQVGPFRTEGEATRALDAALRAAGWELE